MGKLLGDVLLMITMIWMEWILGRRLPDDVMGRLVDDNDDITDKDENDVDDDKEKE